VERSSATQARPYDDEHVSAASDGFVAQVIRERAHSSSGIDSAQARASGYELFERAAVLSGPGLSEALEGRRQHDVKRDSQLEREPARPLIDAPLAADQEFHAWRNAASGDGPDRVPGL